jgi:hypothetical protein
VRLFTLFCIPLLGAGLFAQTAPKPPVKPDVPPVISDAHQKQFFKAQLAITQAQQATQQAQGFFQATVADMAKDCGDKYQPQMGPQGDPVCVAVPQPTKTKEKP